MIFYIYFFSIHISVTGYLTGKFIIVPLVSTHLSVTILFPVVDSGCLYRDCFMYLQPRISFQPRVVLNRESGIFGVWGDMKIVTTL